jgi:hypothetical protein
MTQSTNNGGPAFPVPSDQYPEFNGMTLRDWFAGQYIAGIFGGEPGAQQHPYNAAREAYQVADAMIAAREAAQ